MTLENGLRLSAAEMREVAHLFQDYLDENDALVSIRAKLAEIYDRRPSAQRMVMEQVEPEFFYRVDGTHLESVQGLSVIGMAKAIQGALASSSVDWDLARERATVGLVKESIPEHETLVSMGFGPPYVDLGNGIGATCKQCLALVIDADDGSPAAPRSRTDLVSFALHVQDHRNTERAIIGASGVTS